MTKSALILLSGGIDAATCLALASKEYRCYAISFDYGQKHHAELNAAKKLAKTYDVTEHIIYKLDPTPFAGSALTDHSINIPDATPEKISKSTYVPARNLVFLSIALAYAESRNIKYIYIGSNKDDLHGFHDCREEFIRSFEKTANLATNINQFKIQTPLINLSKTEIIQLGHKLDLDFSNTVTCYCADDKGYACGKCDSCAIRKNAFIEAGIIDPTTYT